MSIENVNTETTEQVHEKVTEVNSKMDFEYYISQKDISVFCFESLWSEPCKKIGIFLKFYYIAPIYEKYSGKFKDLKFLKIDVDSSDGEIIADTCNITVMPTFRAYKENKLLREWKGANEEKLKNELEVINEMK